MFRNRSAKAQRAQVSLRRSMSSNGLVSEAWDEIQDAAGSRKYVFCQKHWGSSESQLRVSFNEGGCEADENVQWRKNLFVCRVLADETTVRVLQLMTEARGCWMGFLQKKPRIAILHGSWIGRSDDCENVSNSIHVNCQCDSNVINIQSWPTNYGVKENPGKRFLGRFGSTVFSNLEAMCRAISCRIVNKSGTFPCTEFLNTNYVTRNRSFADFRKCDGRP
jgi:hypothetical protein